MEAMRDSWTDDRLDDFAAHSNQRFDLLERHMEGRFDQVDARFQQVDNRFDRIEGRLEKIDDKIDRGFARLDARIDQLSVVMFRTMGGLIVTMALGFASLLIAGN